MKALVIGQGSIGQRHARVLRELGVEVKTVSRHTAETCGNYQDLRRALDAEIFDYIVIANNTAEHESALRQLAEFGFSGSILVEKPLFSQIPNNPPQLRGPVFVAYNLRFHPVIQNLRRMLGQVPVISVMAYAGQYLPGWRPDRDYRESYSSSRAHGGGVLRDLSHELDYLLWLFGSWSSFSGLIGRFGALEIDCEDTVSVLAATERCRSLQLQINYLDRVGQRRLIINTAEHTYVADLVRGELLIDGEARSFPVERDDTYRAQHNEIIKESFKDLCTYREGLAIMDLIGRLDLPNAKEGWVDRR